MSRFTFFHLSCVSSISIKRRQTYATFLSSVSEIVFNLAYVSAVNRNVIRRGFSLLPTRALLRCFLRLKSLYLAANGCREPPMSDDGVRFEVFFCAIHLGLDALAKHRQCLPYHV